MPPLLLLLLPSGTTASPSAPTCSACSVSWAYSANCCTVLNAVMSANWSTSCRTSHRCSRELRRSARRIRARRALLLPRACRVLRVLPLSSSMVSAIGFPSTPVPTIPEMFSALREWRERREWLLVACTLALTSSALHESSDADRRGTSEPC